MQDDEDEAAKLANGSSNGSNDKVEDDLGIGDEPETPDLMFFDPKDWKVCLALEFSSFFNQPSL